MIEAGPMAVRFAALVPGITPYPVAQFTAARPTGCVVREVRWIQPVKRCHRAALWNKRPRLCAAAPEDHLRPDAAQRKAPTGGRELGRTATRVHHRVALPVAAVACHGWHSARVRPGRAWARTLVRGAEHTALQLPPPCVVEAMMSQSGE